MIENILFSVIMDNCPKKLNEAIRLPENYDQAIKELCYGRAYAFYLRKIKPSKDGSPVIIPRKELTDEEFIKNNKNIHKLYFA